MKRTILALALAGVCCSVRAVVPAECKSLSGPAYTDCIQNQADWKERIAAPLTTSTNWNYSSETDQMNGSTIKYATLHSDDSLNLGFPYQGLNQGEITIRYRKKEGLNVIFKIAKGQIICSSYDGCALLVRFDDAQPVRFAALEPDDHSSNVLFIRNEARFVELARKAKQIRVAATYFQNGTQVLSFTSPVPLAWEQQKVAKLAPCNVEAWKYPCAPPQ